MTDNCVFCQIVAGDAPATIVQEWDDAIALVPLGPVVDGHVLVIPRLHVQDFTSSPTVTAAVMHCAAEYADFLARPANVISSKGRAATQSVFHLHVHVVPRAEDDGLMVPWGTVYGDDPQAPHWCRVAQNQADRIAELEAERPRFSQRHFAEMTRERDAAVARVSELEAAQPKPALLGYLPSVTKDGWKLVPSDHHTLIETPIPGGVAVWASVPPGGPGPLVAYAVAVDAGLGWFVDTVNLDGSPVAADSRCHDWLSDSGYQAIVVELRQVPMAREVTE